MRSEDPGDVQLATGFRQISRSVHLPTRVAQEIGRNIADGGIAPGRKLPSEHELAGAFGVSRAVVREAIAQLRNEGMVETRQGVGAFVTDPGQRSMIRVERTHLTDPTNLRHFFQLRLPLEIEAARLAARHRTPGDIAALTEALEAMRSAGDWLTEGVRADLAFHRALAAGTQNSYYETFLGFIAERFSSTIVAAFPRPVCGKTVDVTIREHAAIRDAVAAGDAASAADAMRAHLTGAGQRFQITLET